MPIRSADHIEMRVDDFGSFRYLRFDRTGHCEFARYSFYKIKELRAGVSAEPLGARLFDAYYARGVDRFAGTPLGGGEPGADPSDVRLEVHDGEHHRVITYRVALLPAEVRTFHDQVLTLAYEFPDDPRRGDFIRCYAIPDGVEPPHGAVIHPATDQGPLAVPPIRTSLRFPGRLIHVGADDAERLRALADVDPLGFLLRQGEVVHRFSILAWPGK